MKYLCTILSGLTLLSSCLNPAVEDKNEQLALSDTAISKVLEPDTVTVTLEYYGWLCPCAQWITPKNRLIYAQQSKRDLNLKNGIFWNVKTANETVKSPFDLAWDMENLTFEFTGQFYKEPQFIGDEGEEHPARTLLYHSVVLKSDSLQK